jgi:heme-degrading monooxygenase HmoA
MFATIRRYNLPRGTAEEVRRLAEEKFLPKVHEIPGFIGYYFAESDEGLTTVSIFETKEGAEESTRRAGDVLRNDMQRLNLTPPEVFTGKVTLHKEAAVGAH